MGGTDVGGMMGGIEDRKVLVGVVVAGGGGGGIMLVKFARVHFFLGLGGKVAGTSEVRGTGGYRLHSECLNN